MLQINGSPTDAAAGLIKKGIHAGLDSSGYRSWPSSTRRNGRRRRRSNGRAARSPASASKILGVVAANDGTGGGAIAAFKAAGVDPVPPVTGNDATIAALQLIIAGDQYNTISKPSEIVAAAAANVAVKLLTGETPKAEDDALQHALAAVRAGGGHAGEPQGRDHRQEDQHGRPTLHRPLCRRLQEARHDQLIRRPSRPRTAAGQIRRSHIEGPAHDGSPEIRATGPNWY